MWSQLYTDLSWCCTMTFEGEVSILYATLERRMTKPMHIVARSYLILHLYMQDQLYGQYDFPVQVKKHMNERGVPNLLVSTEGGMRFVYQVLVPVYETFKIYLHHPSRQRQRIGAMLQDWQILQKSALELDSKLCTEMSIPESTFPRYFTGWTMDIVLRLEQHFMMLGFELELYDDEEYISMLWYMDCLSSTRMNFYQSTLQFTQQLQAHEKATATESNPVVNGHLAATAILRLQWDIQKLQVHRALGRGLCQFLSALKQDDVLVVKEHEYGSSAIRFQHRVLPFQVIDFPAPLEYADYLASSDFSKYEVRYWFQRKGCCIQIFNESYSVRRRSY